jgi:hypothetical protein
MYVKVESLEKYGADPLLIQRLPLILEEKLDNEKLLSS